MKQLTLLELQVIHGGLTANGSTFTVNPGSIPPEHFNQIENMYQQAIDTVAIVPKQYIVQYKENAQSNPKIQDLVLELLY